MKTTYKFIGIVVLLLLIVTTAITVSVSQSAAQYQIQANQPVDQETIYLPIITRYSCPSIPANPASLSRRAIFHNFSGCRDQPASIEHVYY